MKRICSTIIRARGFTIVEMLIFSMLSILILGGVMSLFSVLANQFSLFHVQTYSFDRMDRFEAEFQRDVTHFPGIFWGTGQVAFGDRSGFQARLFSGSMNSFSGVLYGVYDTIQQEVVIGDPGVHGNYLPFRRYITFAEMTSFLPDSVFLTGGIQLFDTPPLFKFRFSGYKGDIGFWAQEYASYRNISYDRMWQDKDLEMYSSSFFLNPFAGRE